MKVKEAIEYLEQLPQDLEIQQFYDSNIRGKFDGFAYVSDKDYFYRDTNEYSVIPINEEYLSDLLNNNRYVVMDTLFDNSKKLKL